MSRLLARRPFTSVLAAVLLISATWADRLLSAEEADTLAGPDRAAAERRARALGTGWPR